MAVWDKLPFEIIAQIVNTLLETNKGLQWRFVNRQIYDIYASNHYEEMESLDLANLNNKETELILQSALQPGKWLKTLKKLTLKVPENFEDVNTTTDALYRFINRCPNIVQIMCLKKSDEQESFEMWSYFVTAVFANDTWSLKSIPLPDNLQRYSIYYSHIAHYMRNSLAELTITKGMIGKADYRYLSDFKSLKSITVTSDFIGNILDCDILLDYAPQIKGIYVNELEKSPFKPQQSISKETKRFINVKSLNLTKYHAALMNQELLYIQNNFQNLNELKVICSYRRSQAAQDLDTSILRPFLEFLMKLESYLLPMEGISNEEDIMKLYYAAYQATDASNETTVLIDFLTPANVTFKPWLNYEIFFRKERGEPIPTLQLRYEHPVTHKDRIMKVLSNLHKSVHYIRIDWGTYGIEVNDSINKILSQRTSVKELAISGGRFTSYNKIPEIFLRSQSLQELRFVTTNIYNTALASLSLDLPYLKKLSFTNCVSTNNNRINISMENTSIDSLIVAKEPIMTFAMPILLSVTMAGKNISKYYVDVGCGDVISEVSQKKFDVFQAGLKPSIIISIKLKSLKYIELSTLNGDNDQQRTIKLSFPA